MRTLKTKFPCRRCGQPAEVERLRDGPRATCERCAKRGQALMLLNFTHERGKKLCREANKAESPELLAAGWYRGLSEHLEAVARHIEALSLVSPSERRKLAVGAEEWAAWVADKLARLAPRLANIREGTGFEVVSGGLPTDAPEVPANPVAVRLMVVKP